MRRLSLLLLLLRAGARRCTPFRPPSAPWIRDLFEAHTFEKPVHARPMMRALKWPCIAYAPSASVKLLQ